jgi:two-component system, NtrC family, sensor kinase
VPQHEPSILWPLRLIAVLSLVGPALAFSYAAWTSHRALEERTTERIERALNSLQAHAFSALQTIERTITDANDVLRGLSDSEIRADEARLSMRLKGIQDALPQMESIWAFEHAGWPLVSSTILPVLRDFSNADRDYFRAQVERNAGIFIGDIVQARVGTLRFFVVSGRRPGRPAGSFNGIIGITVLPEYFHEFYKGLSHDLADSFGLVRADGTVLAGFPKIVDHPRRLSAQSEFVRAVQSKPERGVITSKSQVDGIERQIAYRKVPGYPVYVQAGVETAPIAREVRGRLLGHVAFGLAATLAMFGLAMYALRRTERSLRRKQHLS